MKSTSLKLLLIGIAFVCSYFEVLNAISTKLYTYDQYGNIKQTTDPRGIAVLYHYGPLNRLSSVEYPGGKKVTYLYDPVGNRKQMEDWHGITAYDYDEFGHVIKISFPNNQSVTYEYDSEENLTKITYPDQHEVTYIYDPSNRLEGIKDDSGLTKFVYDDLTNNLKLKIFPNGTYTRYLYDKKR